MSSNNYTPKSLKELKTIILRRRPLLAIGARTSTVLPERLNNVDLIDLSCLPKEIEILEDDLVKVTGPVSWRELRQELRSKGLDTPCWPTDQTAHVLGGIATSATGERAFHYGTIRSQVEKVDYLDFEGSQKHLNSKNQIKGFNLAKYQQDYLPYNSFKNAPFPRFEVETDLMVGTEGQLGVILSAVLKIVSKKDTMFILVPTPSWRESFDNLHVLSWVLERRSEILSFEFLCASSLKRVETALSTNQDYLVIECLEQNFEEFFSKFLESFKDIEEEKILALDEGKFYELRVSIPRSINEYISHSNLQKMGTDAQVSHQNFKKLLELYREMASKGIECVLFGHFGDAHLHFNFLPKESEVEQCAGLLDVFYKDLSEIEGSPFAEHGIGIIKKKFISRFYTEEVIQTFNEIKNKMDPRRIFFPQGFMGIDDRSKNS